MILNRTLQVFSAVPSRIPTRVQLPERGNRLQWLLGRGNVAPDRDAFFVWQERVLDLLLSWGVGNVIAGAAVAIFRPGIPRAIGVQAVAWGAIDAAVAIYGQCAARRHAMEARSGIYGARHIQYRARRFEHLLAIQTGADIVYVVAGSIFASKSKSPWMRGTAIGVIIQGTALLIYDIGLVARILTRPEMRYREIEIE
ncbi:MAG: DUF6992 family protein [Chloroflexota bacterium]